tara:strand:+ start:10886 stop:12733 length:1848 start_codon:yes stop_codon:yes gene_type:complete
MNLIKKAKMQEESGDIDAAINTLKTELNNNPKNILLQIEIGNLYALIGNYEEASGFFRRSIRVFPDNKDVMEALCFCLCEIGNKYQYDRRYSLAEAAFEELLQYQPKNSDYLFNLANAFFSQDKLDKALSLYQKSLALKKDENTFNNLGNTFRKLGKYNDAIENYSKSIKMNSELIHARIELTHLMQNICDWKTIKSHFFEIKDHIKNKKNGKISPFTVLSMPNIDIKDQLNVANMWAQQKKIKAFSPKSKLTKQKITIGYLSADFRNHPLYYLIYDILKNHDKNHFETKLFYSGPIEKSEQFDLFNKLECKFINISNHNDQESAQIIRNEDIDILIDLSGFTRNSRSMVAAYKPARIHINWLGFAGTMGFYFDQSLCEFIIADEYIIPKKLEDYYAEKVIKLPHCYQPNIEFRPNISKKSKEDYGFAASSFIFGSFSQSIKITEEIFTIWMELLKNTSNTYLWLLQSNKLCQTNLYNFAKNHGIEKKRIRFAPKVDFEEHIVRHQIVDLFLDTFPYNGHTSTSDALWAECPILTISGETFSSRVAGSILTEIGCPELIMQDKDHYYNMALKLYNSQSDLIKIKEKIIIGKKNSNLFKPIEFCKRLENLYKKLLI